MIRSRNVQIMFNLMIISVVMLTSCSKSKHQTPPNQKVQDSAGSPDHYGIYLNSQTELKELIGMRIEAFATSQQLAEHFKKNTVVSHSDAQLLVYFPDFKPTQLELTRMNANSEATPVETFVKPLRKDQYSITPRVSLNDGVYVATYNASLVDTEVFVFAIGKPPLSKSQP